MDKDLHEKLIKICGVGRAGGIFVCVCEQKELRDIMSHVMRGSGKGLWEY